jgi:multidrug efflux pump subunit AcrB
MSFAAGGDPALHAPQASIAGALFVAGVIAAFTLPSSIYPPLEFPRIVIIGTAGTLPPQSMMLTVTRPIEQAMMEVPGVRRVRRARSARRRNLRRSSTPRNRHGAGALQQAQNRVAEIRGELPADAELTVERLTPAVFPVFILSMTGGLPTPDLYDYANYVVRPELARVPGAGRIEVLASDSREIEVVLDPAKVNAAGLTVAEVADTLKAQNMLEPVGRFAEAGQQHLALASGLWKSVDDIAAAPVLEKNGGVIRVSDIGVVVPGAPDRTMLITGNGRDAVSISISQQIGANILTLKQGVDAALTTLSRTLPAGLRITKVYDLAEFVSDSIASVRDAILIGGVLAIVVLIAFLRDVRLTIIAAITLPLAVVPTFLFLRVFGGSINLMSMGGPRRRDRSRHRRRRGRRREHSSAGRGGRSNGR